MLAIHRISTNEKSVFALLIVVGLIGGVLAFASSYFTNSNVLMGLCLFPFALMVEGSRRINLIYAGLMLIFAALASFYGIKICYFFSLAFYFLWLIEFFVGRLNSVVLFLVGFMSPFFIQVVTILGFPIRILLSSYAGSILKIIGVNVQVEGNMMVLDDMSFSVDEACIGLNMLATSMLMGVSVLVYRYRMTKKLCGFYSTTAFFMFVFVLNLVANLVRIIALVYFRIPPENPTHEIIGIISLACYVVAPLYLISSWFVNRFGRQAEVTLKNQHINTRNVLVYILPVIVIFVGVTFRKSYETSGVASHTALEVTEGQTENLNDGVTKVSTDEWLIYIKTIPEFFTGEHTPLMCWKGSGYRFAGVTTTTINNTTIYKGTLVKDGSVLHTAWWYSNGEVSTISQLDWRTRMFKGEKRFCLLNVTAKDERELMVTVGSVLQNKTVTIKN